MTYLVSKLENMLRKLPFILLLLTTIYPTVVVKCQNKSKNSDKPFEIAISVDFNATKFYNNDFINSLKQEGLPTALDKTSFAINSDIYLSNISYNTKLIEVIGVGVANQKKTNNSITLNATALSNDYNLDYIVWKHSRQYFYPGIGIGWMSYNYSFVNNTGTPTSYPQALQNFTGERTIQSGSLAYLNFAANYDWAIDKTNGFLLGIRADYHLGLNHKNLQLSDGYELAQSPELKASSLSIGVALTVQ